MKKIYIEPSSTPNFFIDHPMSKSDIPTDVVNFLLSHKKEGTHPDRIDNLLKNTFPDFHSTLHFSICRIIDEIYTGAYGTYWRAAYNNEITGSTFYKKIDTNYDPNELVLYKIYVEFAGIYTCRLDMQEVQETEGSFFRLRN